MWNQWSQGSPAFKKSIYDKIAKMTKAITPDASKIKNHISAMEKILRQSTQPHDDTTSDGYVSAPQKASTDDS